MLKTQKHGHFGANPIPDDRNYNVIYGFGYAKYIHQSYGVHQELSVFVPKEDSAKISILKLKNITPHKKKLRLYYYAKMVLGEDEIKTDGYEAVKYKVNNNMLEVKNLYCSEFQDTVGFISSSEKIKSYTGDKKFFFGKGGISNPDGITKTALNNDSGLGTKSCAVIEIDVEIESFSEKEISFVLGATDSEIETKDLAYKYSKVNNCNEELRKVKKYWEELLGKVKVQTPVESINIMLNGWAMYQTISSRLLGRSGYYQSGGAYGFRDQLQDALCTKYIDPQILKKQIIKHSEHQFIEGDVEHWWHDELERGIRTRFSDDLLWLPYAVIEYIEFTGDTSILEIETNYLKGDKLEDSVDEKYDKYMPSEIKENIYMHCMRAIKKALNFGENGLPKIGSGDWNDGFSEVGNKGKGESIWLGFFLYSILDSAKGDGGKSTTKSFQINNEQDKMITEDLDLENIKEELKKSLNKNGWDGRWYKRAYMDNGDVLGSMENEECRIDGISQSWSVISGAGDNDKKYISMQSLETHLVDKELGIIKLLDPPFGKGDLEPGYIKAYMPGVRENGGQYTHAAVWAIIAENILGFGDKSVVLYKMINPIEHSRVKDAANKYKVEPYVIPADIYGSNNLAGRGGWTWYTGSSSWFYKAGIEYILGLKIEGDKLQINPCIPKDWKEFKLKYEYKNTIYDITVKNPEGKEKSDNIELFINGEKTEESFVRIKNDGNRYEILAILK